MTTVLGTETEWTAAALRPTARWVPVGTADGGSRMQMVWSVPAVTVPQVVSAA